MRCASGNDASSKGETKPRLLPKRRLRCTQLKHRLGTTMTRLTRPTGTSTSGSGLGGLRPDDHGHYDSTATKCSTSSLVAGSTFTSLTQKGKTEDSAK